MTDTGLPSDSIDWVVSQFGAEYVEPGPLLAELARVLSPSGCVALFLHHAGSRLAEVAREEAAHADWLFAEGGLMTATAQLLEPMSAARTPQGRRRLAKSPLAAPARGVQPGAGCPQRPRCRVHRAGSPISGTRALCPDAPAGPVAGLGPGQSGLA
jgi:SAM-dependent methyltransferase